MRVNVFFVLLRIIPQILLIQGCTIEIGDPGGAPAQPSGKLPVVTTNEVTSASQSAAVCGGIVIDQGSSAITARGVCWNLNENPLANGVLTTFDGMGAGAFESKITGLISDTIYHVRAFATNESGTSYGSNKTFRTLPFPKIPGEGVTDIENNFYPSVIIGAQEWMTKNLMTRKLNDGTSILYAPDDIEWKNSDKPAYCWLINNEIAYKEKYGALYNFYVVETEKICPVGWHVPELSEWTELIDYLSGERFAAKKLKTKDSDIPKSSFEFNGIVSVFEWNGSNEVGFAALASGFRISSGVFNGGVSMDARSSEYWTSSNDDRNDLNYRVSIILDSYITPASFDGKSGFSIRCAKNQ